MKERGDIMKMLIEKYFLDKPGAYEDVDNEFTSLNLAEEKIAYFDNECIHIRKSLNNEVKYDKMSFSNLTEKELIRLLDESYEHALNKLPNNIITQILDYEL